MIIIDGKDAVLGRLASFAAKEAMKGGKIAVVNCDEIIITGNKKQIREDFEHRKKWVGSTQKGPKNSLIPERIVKKTIRGMLPNARRSGRGREAIKRVKCYNKIPRELESAKKIHLKAEKNKFMMMKEIR